MMEQKVSGTVYGVILNDRASLEKIGRLDEAPYKGAPQAPVLYIKPANTHLAATLGDDAMVHLPRGANSVEVAATLGFVMGRPLSRVNVADAAHYVSGLVLAADLSLPHSSYYRPAIREKCFDGALPLSAIVPHRAWVSDLVLQTEIDGLLVDNRSLDDLIRSPLQLLAEVSDWMTLNAGDVLLIGIRYQAPIAQAGSTVRIRAEDFEPLRFSIAKAQGVAA